MKAAKRILRALCSAAGVVVCAIILGAGIQGVEAQTFTTLYNFTGQSEDAGGPTWVVIGNNGVLYGVAGGGTAAQGSVFSLTPPASPGGVWTETVLWSFGGTGDGIAPVGITIGGGGVLYGVTQEGGAKTGGTVFSLTPPALPGGPWTEAILWSFAGRFGGPDGAFPNPGLALDSNGLLYGTTFSGGTSGHGTIFSLAPPTVAGDSWRENILWSFGNDPDDGFLPRTGVAIGNGGVLYGTTSGGGKGKWGIAYSLAPPSSSGGVWIETVLHTFFRKESGSPLALDIQQGHIYGGTNINGNRKAPGGGVFSLTPPSIPGGSWSEQLLFAFPAIGLKAPDGEIPSGPLLLKNNGYLYGATEAGGRSKSRAGTIFKLKPPATGHNWAISILHTFTFTDGAVPNGPLVEGKSGVLYGVTSSGGSAGGGTLFSLTP